MDLSYDFGEIVSASKNKKGAYLDSCHKPIIVVFHLFFLVHLFYFILFIYMYVYFLFIFIFILFSHGFLSNTWLDIHKVGLQQEIVHIAANLTRRKLNTQQIIAYPSEKQGNISKNKPKKKKKYLGYGILWKPTEMEGQFFVVKKVDNRTMADTS